MVVSFKLRSSKDMIKKTKNISGRRTLFERYLIVLLLFILVFPMNVFAYTWGQNNWSLKVDPNEVGSTVVINGVTYTIKNTGSIGASILIPVKTAPEANSFFASTIGSTITAVGLTNPVSCMSIKKGNAAAADGVYTIDPDGNSGNAAFSIYCDMTYDGGGWTRVSSDIPATATSWDNSSITSATVAGVSTQVHGMYATGNQLNRTFDLLGVSHTQLRVKARYYAIDSWDTEANGAQVWVDGTQKFSATKTYNTVGSGAGWVSASFTPAPWANNAYTNGYWNVEEQMGIISHTGTTAAISFRTGLDQAVADESFAVSHVEVYVRNQADESWVAGGGSNCNATGGTITEAGGYRIHTFTTSGTFTPSTACSAEVLVVAGGGGGGRYGGGGGGGVLTGTLSFTAQAYTTTIGSGGAGWVGDTQSGGNAGSGGNSVLSSMTAIGGGGAGCYGNPMGSSGASGGSGGGGGNTNGGGTTNGGSGTSGQGYAGGGAPSGNYSTYGGGGGGGAGGAGANGTTGGQGGIGAQSSISGAATYYGGGGSGCQPSSNLAGGQGGGGTGFVAGATWTSAIDGVANTGGGGGGGRDNPSNYRAGNGGSGIVIVKYPISGGSAPKTSCLEILQTGASTGNGVYTIDPDGTGGNDPYQAYCDMTYDGGGWTKVVSYFGNTNVIGSAAINANGSWTTTAKGLAAGKVSTADITRLIGSSNSFLFRVQGGTGDNLLNNGAGTGKLVYSGTLPSWGTDLDPTASYTLYGDPTSSGTYNYSVTYSNDGQGRCNPYGAWNWISDHNYNSSAATMPAGLTAPICWSFGASTVTTNLHWMSLINNSSSAGNVVWGDSNSSFSIYVRDVVSSCPAIGGTVTEAGGNCVHTFTTSGTFAPTSALTAKVLVVAGGGGGGTGGNEGTGGGGGAGGYIYNASFAIAAQSYSVIIGSGGVAGANGSNAVFSSLTAVGGGSGGSNAGGENGATGGSGGGAQANYGSVGPQGGAGTSGQGYAGANSYGATDMWRNSGGGGGSGSAGVGGGTAPNGGAGTPNSITGSSIAYAAGGGGGQAAASRTNYGYGTGGSGIGGNGGANQGGAAATNGAVNTGSGGGGQGHNGSSASGSGGSGVVIISYPKPSGGGGSSSCSATGGTITTSGSYKIHTFTTSGTFTPSGNCNVEALVVGGGGGGSNNEGSNRGGGGGGAGGLIYNASYAVTAQAYSVVVASGGGVRTSGGNSSFGTLIAAGGGAGAYQGNGTAGGSGGGAGQYCAAYSGGAGTSGQGNSGGSLPCNNCCYNGGPGAGGGGAGGAGSEGSSGDNLSGGGPGVANSISGTSLTYAAGGGAGVYASPGMPSYSGAANTGNGGSGSRETTAGSGGSGIVIIRYLQ